jgi:hypothetical protein
MESVIINGKKSSQIAREYGVSIWRVAMWAKEKGVPFISLDGGKTVEAYIFDEEEKKFAERRRKSTGRPRIEKPQKIPGKPGRPRKEKPVDNKPKIPVERPRKYPVETLDIVPMKARGRLRKHHAEGLDTRPKKKRRRPRKG